VTLVAFLAVMSLVITASGVMVTVFFAVRSAKRDEAAVLTSKIKESYERGYGDGRRDEKIKHLGSQP